MRYCLLAALAACAIFAPGLVAPVLLTALVVWVWAALMGSLRP